MEKLPSYYESDDYISHTDRKKQFAFEKMYHFIKGIALKKQVEINQFTRCKRKASRYWCWNRRFLAVAKSDGWQTVGIEPSAKAKEIAIKKGKLRSGFSFA